MPPLFIFVFTSFCFIGRRHFFFKTDLTRFLLELANNFSPKNVIGVQALGLNNVFVKQNLLNMPCWRESYKTKKKMLCISVKTCLSFNFPAIKYGFRKRLFQTRFKFRIQRFLIAFCIFIKKTDSLPSVLGINNTGLKNNWLMS